VGVRKLLVKWTELTPNASLRQPGQREARHPGQFRATNDYLRAIKQVTAPNKPFYGAINRIVPQLARQVDFYNLGAG
jgi:hypothetical protein